jgi:hypothetical protein
MKRNMYAVVIAILLYLLWSYPARMVLDWLIEIDQIGYIIPVIVTLYLILIVVIVACNILFLKRTKKKGE